MSNELQARKVVQREQEHIVGHWIRAKIRYNKTYHEEGVCVPMEVES